MKGFIEAGPNAVLATRREGYRKRDVSLPDLVATFGWPGFWKMAARDWKTGAMEVHRSWRKSVFVRDLQRLVPEVRSEDLVPGGSGVRAQAVDRAGRLLDDFRIEETEHMIHVLNAPSPGATSSRVIGAHLAALAARAFGWKGSERLAAHA
jgi:L-2-hydroxyglutarate oxidase